MYIFFMDSQGMLLKHAVPRSATVNKEYYQKVVRRDLTNAIRKKRAGCDIENLIFHQDNAPAHRADETLLTIDFLGYERLRHPPYSPDLAPLDFCVFPRLKADLRGRRFDTEDEIKYAVRSAIRSYTPEWYADIYRKWVQRHRKCIEHNGDYFEKA
ncbi:histone-lysine N-methyltransferase SETMAR-like [Ruditapes philippinarum]|uniref:histone-lysine N-methyltransferase SETMAR-like n=1 Tax=Ruditapes philippinarum TaxID=129788 RepID=UPI00295B4B72|nr:histone-lysine N-methyltransferase SETMAR-like [Ruditapes philippinarum]